MPSTYVSKKNDYVGELGVVLQKSVSLNFSVMEGLREFVPEMVDSLKHLAKGAYREVEYTNKRGQVIKRIYEEKPDTAAISLLMRLALTSPKESADTLLSISRAHATVADTSLKLEQRKLVIETALTMTRNRIAADRSLVDEESIESVVSKCVLDMLGFIQSLQLDEYPIDDLTKTRFVERYKDRCLQVFNDAIDALPGQGALETVSETPPKKRRGRPPKKRPSAAFGDDVSESEGA